jgi:hypothetical protein
MAKKLLDQLREELRLKHYSYRTEQAYVDWVRRFILFQNSSQNPASGCSILGLWTTCLGGEDRWGFRS